MWPGTNAGRGLNRQSPCGGVDLGMAQPGGLAPVTDLAGAEIGIGALLDDQGLSEGSYDGCLHGFSPPWKQVSRAGRRRGGGVVQYGVLTGGAAISFRSLPWCWGSAPRSWACAIGAGTGARTLTSFSGRPRSLASLTPVRRRRGVRPSRRCPRRRSRAWSPPPEPGSRSNPASCRSSSWCRGRTSLAGADRPLPRSVQSAVR